MTEEEAEGCGFPELGLAPQFLLSWGSREEPGGAAQTWGGRCFGGGGSPVFTWQQVSPTLPTALLLYVTPGLLHYRGADWVWGGAVKKSCG